VYAALSYKPVAYASMRSIDMSEYEDTYFLYYDDGLPQLRRLLAHEKGKNCGGICPIKALLRLC
jgi:hypothetical protein